MKTINLIDTIGVETGMHKYNEAFVTLCKKRELRLMLFQTIMIKM